ncbi:hypothetical protein M2352_000939 [Azospirillum fermentarium]|uniref:hypothetical protein n=1 Tax=Azospirillum fermentarium TaxID=1233114 RepID=UPI0022276583|nr:hypothetical protein [Azospirillum fermentarium]MCW2245348.1 hypothetical protein [Azospirillum fermentarium]
MQQAFPAPRPSTAPPLAVRAPFAMEGIPFPTAAEAWFWAVQAQVAKNDGARVAAGLGLVVRPCEPGDIIRAVDRLHRRRQLTRDHLHVLVHYGRRMDAPKPDRWREQRAASLWREAFAVIAPALVEKGIVAAGTE